MINPGETCKVFIEKPDGSVMELTSMVRSFTINHKCDYVDVREGWNKDPVYLPTTRLVEMSIDLVGIGPLIETTSRDFSSRINTATEWKCDYCGRPNAREKETCSSCGSVRSFVYG